MPALTRPRSPETRSLGLDIGTRAVKFVLARDATGRFEIDFAGAIDLTPEVVGEGRVLDAGEFARAIRSRLAKEDLAGVPVIFSIPSNLAALRWISLPRMTGEDLVEAAKFKVRRHLPFPVDDAFVEVSQAEEEGAEVLPSLVVAVRRDVVESRAEAIVRAGLRPAKAELEAQAILRVVERQLQVRSVLWRDASLTIIDVGGLNTHMYVVQNQRLQFIRGVGFGSEMFARAISERLEIPLEQGSRVLGTPGAELRAEGTLVVPVEAGLALIDLTRELEKLTREFLRLLRYFRSLHPERSYAGILDHVVVCGGLAGLAGFDRYLEAKLGLRVDRARPIAGTIARFDRLAFENVASRQEAFTVATGLALSGLKGEERREADGGHEFVWKRGA